MNRLVANRNLLLLVAVLVSCCAIPIADQLSFNQSIESFFAPENPDIRLLRRSRSEFGGDEFVVIAWAQDDLLTRDEDRGVPSLSDSASARISMLAEQLNNVPGINPARTRHLIRYLSHAPRSRNTRSAMLELFEGLLIGADGRTTAVILQLIPESRAPVSRGETLREVRRIVADFDPTAAVAGEPVQIHDMFDLVERDGRLLYLVSVAVMSLVLFVIFRGLRWMIASIGIVMATVVTTRAALVLTGTQLSMVSSMLNSLMTVISVATTMHIIVNYREFRATQSPVDAAVSTLRDLAQPVFWSILTTAVGFSALLVTDVVPVRSFAIMMAAGTVMVLIFTLAIAPAMLASGSNVRMPGRAPLEDTLDRILNRIAWTIETHPISSGLVCLMLMLITAPGLFLLTVETDFSRNFRRSSPIVQSLQFVETNLGGAGTWEVAFDVPGELSSEFLDETRVLTDELQKMSDDGFDIAVLSLNDAIDMPPRLGSSLTRFERLSRTQSDLIESFYNPTAHRMRVILRSREQQPAEAKLAQIERVRQIVADHFSVSDADQRSEEESSHSPASASGLYVLLAHLIDSLLTDQLTSFLAASGGILVCMVIAFRNLRIGLISLLPNIFPVVLVIGAMGVLGIPINIGTAMIASVSMGLTVDSTIHYITAFERARRQHPVAEALRLAHGGAGRAMVLAYLALVAGFLVLTVSAFIPLVYFGALLSLSMIGGLVGDLVLLPLLLRWTTPATEQPPEPAADGPES